MNGDNGLKCNTPWLIDTCDIRTINVNKTRQPSIHGYCIRFFITNNERKFVHNEKHDIICNDFVSLSSIWIDGSTFEWIERKWRANEWILKRLPQISQSRNNSSSYEWVIYKKKCYIIRFIHIVNNWCVC